MPKPVPFPFILDYLLPLNPVIKPMFGCHALYVGDRIVFIMRQSKSQTGSNGLWIATSYEHHASLKKEFPSLCSVHVLNGGARETGWQMLPADADDFEEACLRVCGLVLKGDKRIGRIPKPKHRRALK